MAQQKKNQPAKPEDLSSIIKSHIVEETNWLPQLSSDLHMCTVVFMPHTHTKDRNIIKQSKYIYYILTCVYCMGNRKYWGE